MVKPIFVKGILALIFILSLIGCSSSTKADQITDTLTPVIDDTSIAEIPTLITTTLSPGEEPTVASTESAKETIPVIFDDDGSRDGMVALFYLLGNSAISVDAITISYGEAHPEPYIQLIGQFLDDVGIEGITLGAGQDAPLAGNHAFPDWLRAGSENFWGIPLSTSAEIYPYQNAAELIVSTVKSSAEPITFFLSGACTNLAQALRLDPSIAENIEAVYIMGGAINTSGNITNLIPDSDNKVAEWNIYADPQAASEVFQSGLQIYLVPLDPTNLIEYSQEQVNEWRNGGPLGNYAAKAYDQIFVDFGMSKGTIWDAYTAVVMSKPELCDFSTLSLKVITTEGDTSGQTSIDPENGKPVQVCLVSEGEQIRQELLNVFLSGE